MKTKKDKYNLSQQSSSKKSGIEAFQHEKNKGFYFHINDSKGNAILYSQSYTSAHGRNNGIQSVLKNKNEEKRYKTESSKASGHYFTLKAGNNQEIARSCNFKTLTELNKQLAYLQKAKFIYKIDKTSIAAPLKKKKTKPTKKIIKAFSSEKADKIKPLTDKFSTKHAFHIDIYQDGNGVFGTGKIVHLLSKHKIALKGLEFSKIQEFIELYTGQKQEEVSVEEKLKDENDSGEVELKSKEKMMLSMLKGPFVNQMFITLANQLGQKKQVKTSDMFTVNMKLDEQSAYQRGIEYRVKCSAISLSTGSSIDLGTKQVTLQKGSEVLYFPIISNVLSPDIYRLQSTLTPEIKETKSLKALESDCIIRIY